LPGKNRPIAPMPSNARRSDLQGHSPVCKTVC
jgi:hypothetical protein